MRNRSCRRFAAFAPLVLCALTGGCASQPPEKNALSGIRLRVTMTFAQGVNPNYLYYFVINNAGSINAPGPIPVGGPISGTSYGNGFATASDAGASSATNKGGFTDFVFWGFNQYGGQSQNGYSLYHVLGDANDRSKFISSGVPFNSTAPSTNPDDTTSTTLFFEIDLSQLIRSATGGTVDANTAANTARTLQYFQVNMIATNIAPLDSTTSVTKFYDSMGDNFASARGSFLTIDVRQSRTYTSRDTTAPETNEPTSSDVVGGTNISNLDLRSWSIEVVRTN